MEQLNNLDVVFLIIVGISALVGIARGMTKEVLSITGWILAAMAVIYLTPIIDPIMQKYISSKMLCSFVSGLVILIMFCIFWVLSADKLSSTIRLSSLSALDRVFGFLFGLARGILIVILVAFMIITLIPEESKKGVFAESRYFKIAGESAEPLKNMIPQSWIDGFKEKSETLIAVNNEDKNKTEDENSEKTDISDDVNKTVEKVKQINEVVDNIKMLKKNGEDLFNELAQPKPASNESKDGEGDFIPSDLDRLLDVLEDRVVVTEEQTGGIDDKNKIIEIKESVAETVN